MKIFVTTGSAFPFDSLIKYLDQERFKNNFTFIFQIGNGKYLPTNHKYYRFVKNIDIFFQNSDIIICHAGAGTIFNLLENSLPFIALPNFDRKDAHQNDICRFLIRENFGRAVFNLKDLEKEIQAYKVDNFKRYINNNEKIIEFIMSHLK